MEEAEPPKENVDRKRFSWLECEPLPLPQLREGGEEPFRVEEMSSKRRSPMRVVGQRGKVMLEALKWSPRKRREFSREWLARGRFD